MITKTGFDDGLMKDTAAKKGFETIAQHLHHLTNESPQCCRIMYHHYKKIFNCQGKTSVECEKLRDLLVSNCGAEHKGNSIGFNWFDNTHILENYIDKEYLLEVQAALRGVSEKKFKEINRKRFWRPEAWGIYTPPS